MIEVVHPLHSVLSYGDVVKHQAVHEAVLHTPDHLLLTQHAWGGYADVLEGQNINITYFVIRPLCINCIDSIDTNLFKAKTNINW